MSGELSCHRGVVYLVWGSHAYESTEVSVGLQVRPSGTDKLEKTKHNNVVKPQLSNCGWEFQALICFPMAPHLQIHGTAWYQLHIRALLRR